MLFDSAGYSRLGFGSGNDGDRYWFVCLGAIRTRVEFSDRNWQNCPPTAGKGYILEFIRSKPLGCFSGLVSNADDCCCCPESHLKKYPALLPWCGGQFWSVPP